MFKTGNAFIDVFSYIIALFPLLPAIIILIRKIYTRDVINFLLILCILMLFEGIMESVAEQINLNNFIIHNIFSIPATLMLTLIFKTSFTGWNKQLTGIFITAFFSVVLTWYFIKGIDKISPGMEALKDLAIIVISGAALLKLILKNDLFIFRSVIFWISVGTLFYFLIALLLEVVDNCCLPANGVVTNDKIILLNIASLVRYVFYTAAVIFDQRRKDNN